MVSNDPAIVSSKPPQTEHPIPDAETSPNHDTTTVETPADQPPSVPSPSSYSSFPLKDVLETTKSALNLPENETKALAELKSLLRDAISKNELLPKTQTSSPPPQPTADDGAPPTPMDKTTTTETHALPTPPAASTAENDDKCAPEEELVPDDGDSTVTKSAIDEDGANCKTVEAIEESIVSSSSASSSSSVTHPQTTEPSSVDHPQNENPSEHQSPAPAPYQPSIWGIPLLTENEKSDMILWKFLQARDFKPKEAFTMLKSTLNWRNQFKIDEMMTNPTDEFESEDRDLSRAVFMHGVSKEGHPVCYNVYGEFGDKELYNRTFSDEEKRLRFLKWRILFLERSVRKLDFRVGGVSTIVQVNDLKNSPGIGKWELRQATNQALQLLQDNYPEFVAKQVFINVPWWYRAASKMMSPFLTQRSKSKIVVAGPSKSAETLFNYIDAEQVPVQYGGLSRDDGEFSVGDTATQIIIKPGSKETVEFSVTEECQLTWELRVLGWDVSYGAEFVPNAEDKYTVIIQKMKKVIEEKELTVIRNSFKVGEPGRVIFTIDNSSSRKKRLLYRLKSKPPCHD